MVTKIIGFSSDYYTRESVNGIEYFKNIIPLDEMTPRQRYELALSDDENAIIWDDIDSFLTDLNDECISVNNMWVYKYNED